MNASETPDQSARPVRVCHINPLSYPVLLRDAARPPEATGGAELQQALVARAAVRRGWIHRSSRWTSAGERDRSRWFSDPGSLPGRGGLAGSAILSSAPDRLYRALRRADADVYYLSAGDGFLGIVHGSSGVCGGVLCCGS